MTERNRVEPSPETKSAGSGPSEFTRNHAAALSNYITKKYGDHFEPDNWLEYWSDIAFFVLASVSALEEKR